MTGYGENKYQQNDFNLAEVGLITLDFRLAESSISGYCFGIFQAASCQTLLFRWKNSSPQSQNKTASSKKTLLSTK